MQSGRVARIAAAMWLVFVACLGVVVAETDGVCSRCGAFVKLSDEGSGFDRTWQGLCGACQDPKRRCDDVVRDLERKYEAARDRLGYMRLSLQAAQHALAGTDEERKVYQEHVGFPASFDVDFWSKSIQAQEEELAELQRRLDAVKAQCAGGGSGAGGGANPGTAPAPGSATSASGLGGILRNQVDFFSGLAKLLSSQVKALENVGGIGAGLGVAETPIEASTIEGLAREAKPLVDGAGAAGPTATSESATSGSAEPPAASTAELVKPDLVDVEADLPSSPVARDVARWQRHTANGAETARALQRSLAQIDAASAAGDPKRAEAHRVRSLVLAARGQHSLRDAESARQAALRRLYEDGKWLEGRAEGDHSSPADVLAAWQARVRAEGLPADYAAGLKASGLSDADVAKHREWLQSVDVRPLALVHARLMHRVAPLEVPDVRGSAAGIFPPGDDLWDQIALRLLEPRSAPR